MSGCLRHIVFIVLLFPANMLAAQVQLVWDTETYNTEFARVDSFMALFQSLHQFREPGGDTLCEPCLLKFRKLFADGVKFPDLINPVWLNTGEMVFNNRVAMKDFDRFTGEVRSNFPAGLMVRFKGRNYNFRAIAQDHIEIVLERRVRGLAKNRWQVDVTDTVMIRLSGIGQSLQIKSMDILGYSHVLTDVKELSAKYNGVEPDIYLRQQIRQWERVRRSRSESEFAPALAVSDSVARNSPCACADRVPSVDVFYAAVNHHVAGSNSYKKSPMIAFSDRSGNYSQVAPLSDAESHRELQFLQPFFVVDTAGQFVHIVEYNPAALTGSDYRIRRCLLDFGWVRTDRLVLGLQSQFKDGEPQFCRAHEQLSMEGAKTSRALCFRVFQNPALNNERFEPPAADELYIFKRTSEAVLIGNAPAARAGEIDEVLLGWRSINGLIWDNNEQEKSIK